MRFSPYSATLMFEYKVTDLFIYKTATLNSSDFCESVILAPTAAGCTSTFTDCLYKLTAISNNCGDVNNTFVMMLAYI